MLQGLLLHPTWSSISTKCWGSFSGLEHSCSVQISHLSEKQILERGKYRPRLWKSLQFGENMKADICNFTLSSLYRENLPPIKIYITIAYCGFRQFIVSPAGWGLRAVHRADSAQPATLQGRWECRAGGTRDRHSEHLDSTGHYAASSSSRSWFVHCKTESPNSVKH